MKHLKTYKLFEGREPEELTRPKRDVSDFSHDEVMDIENMFLEYADKWGMQEVKFEHDDEEDADYPLYDVNGVDFQYHVGRYRNVAIDIYFIESDGKGLHPNTTEKSKQIEKDLKDNFLPRLESFGYQIIYFGTDWSDWKDRNDNISDDEKKEITIVIGKR